VPFAQPVELDFHQIKRVVDTVVKVDRIQVPWVQLSQILLGELTKPFESTIDPSSDHPVGLLHLPTLRSVRSKTRTTLLRTPLSQTERTDRI